MLKKTLLTLAIITHIPAYGQQLYTESECESLSSYVLDAIKKNHAAVVKDLTSHLLKCSKLDRLKRGVDFIDTNAGLLAAYVLATIGANLDNALPAAIYWHNIPTAKYLLENGACVNGLIDVAPDMSPEELIPLMHYAIQKGYSEEVELLVRYGYDLNSFFGDMTPLMTAAWYGQNDIVKILLERGADARIRNKDEYTALDYAFRWPSALGWSCLNPATLRLLEQATANQEGCRF